LPAYRGSALSGSQQVRVNGATATDAGFSADGHPSRATLVNQNGKWLLDTAHDQDLDAIQQLISSWVATAGGKVCNFDSTADLTIHWGDH